MNNAEQRRAKIRNAFLNAAFQLIMEQGYDAVTVTDIARLADYGRSTFYLHFKDKEALVWAMLEQYMSAIDERIIDSVTGLDSPLREWRAWQIIFMETDRQRQFWLMLDGELSRRLRQIQRDYLNQVFEQQLRAGQYSLMIDDVPFEIQTRFVDGAMLEILDYWLTHPEIGDAEQMAAYFFTLVFRQSPPGTA